MVASKVNSSDWVSRAAFPADVFTARHDDLCIKLQGGVRQLTAASGVADLGF
ncbi:hypothetical protein CASFOL_032454 [Castilleja foliolosa]|uniref:Uncharacterized protein n=1 Tax=Castilleja foliolosa TaxID=1961234 RepID=A0ABD3C1H8_9LAMI